MSEEQKPGSEILGEIESLGQKLVMAVKSLWESEDSRRLRQEIAEGFAGLGRQIDTAIKSAQESEAARRFSDKARESDIAGKVEQGLVSGLRELNEQLAKLIASLEKKEPPQTGPEGGGEA